jgi:hypothetical protein
LANYLLIKDYDLSVGYVVMAAIPSAVVVLPFTYLLKGNMTVSLIGSASLYLLALAMASVQSVVPSATAPYSVTVKSRAGNLGGRIRARIAGKASQTPKCLKKRHFVGFFAR